MSQTYWIVVRFGNNGDEHPDCPKVQLYEDLEFAMEEYGKQRRSLIEDIEKIKMPHGMYRDEVNRDDYRVIAQRYDFENPQGVMMSPIVPDKPSVSETYWVVIELSSDMNDQGDCAPSNPICWLYSTEHQAKEEYSLAQEQILDNNYVTKECNHHCDDCHFDGCEGWMDCDCGCHDCCDDCRSNKGYYNEWGNLTSYQLDGVFWDQISLIHDDEDEDEGLCKGALN
tara:strand:- start:698 stop:1375 length:678 start_codon:yes stop_codon:yes gene_type:complete